MEECPSQSVFPEEARADTFKVICKTSPESFSMQMNKWHWNELLIKELEDFKSGVSIENNLNIVGKSVLR